MGVWEEWVKQSDIESKAMANNKVNQNIVINRRRFCKILFLDLIFPNLPTLVESMNQPKLHIGLQKDKHLHKSIL